VVVAVALVTAGGSVLAACGGDDGGDRSSATTTAAPSTSGRGGAPTTSEGTISVCQLVNPETVSNIVGEQLTPQPTPTGGCAYDGETPTSRSMLITVVASGGDAGAKGGAEQRLGGKAEALDVPDADAWIVFGDEQGAPGAEVGAEAKDSLITITMSTTDQATDRRVATELLTHVIDALG